LDQTLKIDFLSFDRVLQFSPTLFDGSRRGMSQMIENYFLYKKALIRLFFEYFLYEKGAKTEKTSNARWHNSPSTVFDLNIMYRCLLDSVLELQLNLHRITKKL